MTEALRLLAERVEKASDRETGGIFADVAAALGMRSGTEYPVFWRFVQAGAYLDAAMSLVPEGWSLSMGERRGRPEHIRWEVWLADHNAADGIAEFHVEANAATPALALCAAALRARAAQEQRNEP